MEASSKPALFSIEPRPRIDIYIGPIGVTMVLDDNEDWSVTLDGCDVREVAELLIKAQMKWMQEYGLHRRDIDPTDAK